MFCGPSMVFTNVYNPRSAVIAQGRVSRYADQARRHARRQLHDRLRRRRRRARVRRRRHAWSIATCPRSRLMVGVPARQIGWMSRFGERLDLPLGVQRRGLSGHRATRYVLRDACMPRLRRRSITDVLARTSLPGSGQLSRAHAATVRDAHLRDLFAMRSRGRFARFSRCELNLLFDFSRQRLTERRSGSWSSSRRRAVCASASTRCSQARRSTPRRTAPCSTPRCATALLGRSFSTARM